MGTLGASTDESFDYDALKKLKEEALYSFLCVSLHDCLEAKVGRFRSGARR